MKYKIGEKVKEINGGYYICSPDSFADCHLETLQHKNGTHTNNERIIKNIATNKYGNWYAFEDYSNWVTEEGLESLTNKEDLYPIY